MTALSSGSVKLTPAATVRCPMIPAMDRWMNEVVQPAALRHFGARVTNVKVAASYGCRPRNNKPGGKLSEHGYANALDVSRFTFADGRTAEIKEWRRGPSETRAFLRAVHKRSCKIFTTVLGPNADKYHWDHFHFDLARHGRRGTFHYCR
ncbi:MAG: extensin family protein [Pseudomonadota bacterium]